MEHVLAFIQELNELACAAFIEKLFPLPLRSSFNTIRSPEFKKAISCKRSASVS